MHFATNRLLVLHKLINVTLNWFRMPPSLAPRTLVYFDMNKHHSFVRNNYFDQLVERIFRDRIGNREHKWIKFIELGEDYAEN